MSEQMRRTSSTARARVVVALALFAGILAVPAIATAGGRGPSTPTVAPSNSSGRAQPGIGTPADDQWRGLRWAGLKKAATTSPCRNGYEIAGPTVRCTHGPDPAPAGVSVLRYRSTNELRQSTAQATAADTTPSATTSSGTGVVGCYDDGQSGDRIQALYVHAAGVTDRYASLSSLFPQWAANIDASFNDSAALTGGVRHVRYLTDASCNLIVDDVQLSATGADSIGNTMTELKGLGYNRTDRKYVVWADANVYCGIGTVRPDDQPGQTNANNFGPSFARVDSGCWGQAAPAEAHELMHMLGGVQNSAPHATGGYHCYDESDLMCYNDGSPGVVLTYTCPAQNERLFDCNHDDYFNLNPPAGSYLATHWDSANNAFLAQTDPVGFGTTTSTSSSTTSSTAPTSTTVPSAQANSTTTATFSGSIVRRQAPPTYAITAGAGALNATLTCSNRVSMTLTLTTAGGSKVANARGRVPVNLSTQVPGGSYNLVISSTVCPAYTLTVSYQTPASA